MNTYEHYEEYIADALDLVSAWELEPEQYDQAVNDQARLMAGVDLEPRYDIPAVSPYHPLQF